MSSSEPVPRLNLERETAALRELGETRVSAPVARALVIAFAVGLAVVPALELALPGRSGPGPLAALAGLGTWPLDDCAIEDVEDQVEERSRVAAWLRPLVQGALTGVFGLGNEQAYAGREGWLFQRAGFDHLTGRGFLDPDFQRRRVSDADPCQDAPEPDPLPAITRFHEDLAARGIALVVLPTPVKGVLEGDRLGGRPGALVRNASFEPFVAGLRERGVTVFDPAPLLRDWRDRRQGPDAGRAYLATDTHWRPEAVDAVAENLAGLLERDFELGPRGAAGRRRPVPVENRGDLAALLDLPPGRRPPLESVTVQEVRTAEGRLWKPTRGAPVLLLGDSFSNIYAVRSAFAQSEGGLPLDWGESAGLAEQLAFHLARPVDRIARNAGGASATRRDLVRELGSGRDRLAGVRVVVWQFAVRELSQGDWPVLPLSPSPVR